MSSPSRTKLGTWCAALLIAVATFAVVPAGGAYADAAGKGGDFVPLAAPVPLLDTRSGLGATAGVRTGGSTTTVQVLGRAGVPAAGVSAVLVDVAVVNPTTGTVLTVWPDLTDRPGVSMLNADPGVVQSNTAIVPVGSNGKINIYNHAGSTHLVADVHGYFLSAPSTGTGLGGFVPMTHTRLVDTRSGLGAPAATIPSGGTITVTVGNGAPVPATANAAWLNLTVVGATAQSYLSTYPAGGAVGSSTIDFPTGTSAQSTAVKLGTGGRVVIRNAGGGAIHLLVDAQGYFTAAPTSGAGLRPSQRRLLDTRSADNPIPAGGTIDVAVGGGNGLPTRNIAGAALNLTAVTPAGTGFLVAWPTGETAPATSINNFPPGGARASLAVVRPGREGKVTIRNSSSGSLHLVVDLEGWFADPLPGVPVTPYARGAAIQASPANGALVGALEFAYVDNIGRLVHGRIPDPDNLSGAQWTPISGGEAFSGTPAIASQPDGRVQVTAQHTDSNIWSLTQVTAGMPGWGEWSRLGGSMATPTAAQRMPDGALVQFAVDADGQLWVLSQTAANGSYATWRCLGAAGLTGTPAVVAVNGALQVVAMNADGALRTATYHPGGALSAWTELDGSELAGGAGLTGSPAVVVYPGYRLRVFARAADGAVVTKAQDSAGTFAAAWTPVGDLVSAGSPAALLHPTNGRTEVIARRADGTVHASRETSQGSGQWGAWVQAPGDGFVAATDPTVLTYTGSAGPTYLFVARDTDNAQHVWFPPSAAALARSASGSAYTGFTMPAPAR